MTDLHPSHRWAEHFHAFIQDDVVYCIACGAEGYDDVPQAFAPCTAVVCGVTMNSWDDPGHVHFCVRPHDDGLHLCGDKTCGRRFNP